jgi:hypothetical protein
MNTFYEHHQDSIRFAYRCFDRILLNGLIQPFQQPERVVGFFNTSRELYPVSKPVLKDIARQYEHWVTARNRARRPNPHRCPRRWCWPARGLDDDGEPRDRLAQSGRASCGGIR